MVRPFPLCSSVYFNHHKASPGTHIFPRHLNPCPQYGSVHPPIWPYPYTSPTFKTLPLCPLDFTVYHHQTLCILNLISVRLLYALTGNEICFLCRTLFPPRPSEGGCFLPSLPYTTGRLALLKSLSLQTAQLPILIVFTLMPSSEFISLNPPCFSHL